MSNRHGLTLLEILAATVVLGLLAAAVTPLYLRVASGQLRSAERLDAQVELIQAWDAAPRPLSESDKPSLRHPAWRVVWEKLTPRIPSSSVVVMPHVWWRISVQNADNQILAERVQVVPSPVPTNAPATP